MKPSDVSVFLAACALCLVLAIMLTVAIVYGLACRLHVKPFVNYVIFIIQVHLYSLTHSRESPPNFERLVLGSIDADFGKEILVGKLLTRSTRFTYFCTAQISKFQPKIVNIFSRMKNAFPNFPFFALNFAEFSFCRKM